MTKITDAQTAVNANITANGRGAITGPILNSDLTLIISAISDQATPAAFLAVAAAFTPAQIAAWNSIFGGGGGVSTGTGLILDLSIPGNFYTH